MTNGLIEKEKPQFSQPESYDEAMRTPGMEKARKTVETLVRNGRLVVSPELYPHTGEPRRLISDQLQFLPVVGVDIPVLIVAPFGTDVELHESSTSGRIIIRLPRGTGDNDPCHVLDMRQFQIYPRQTTVGNIDTNYGSAGYCATGTGDYLSAPAVRYLLQDPFLAGIVQFAGCEAEAAAYPHMQIAAMGIASNF